MMSAGNPEAAYESAKNGAPQPKEASSHNFSEDEISAWERGREEYEQAQE